MSPEGHPSLFIQDCMKFHLLSAQPKKYSSALERSPFKSGFCSKICIIVNYETAHRK